MKTNVNRGLLAIGAAAALGVAMWPALAQPGSGGGGKDNQPGNRGPGGGDRGDRGGRGGDRGPRSEWAEKFRDDLREHPRLARAIVALHEAKDYIEKPAAGAGDFGGKKDAAMKACDDAIKALTEAMKFDPKREPGQGRGEGGDDKGKGKGEGGGGDKK